MKPAGSQFEYLRDHGGDFDPSRGKTTFVATSKDDDYPERAAGTVAYYPPSEVPTGRRRFTGDGTPGEYYLREHSAYPEPGVTPQQGQLFQGHPAKVDMLAVDEEHRGEGLGKGLAAAAVDEHQRRFGHNSYPEAAQALSADSSGLATHLTGREHKQVWGSGIDRQPFSDDPRPEDTFARDRLGDLYGEASLMRDNIGYGDAALVRPSNVFDRVKTLSAPQFEGTHEEMRGQRKLF